MRKITWMAISLMIALSLITAGCKPTVTSNITQTQAKAPPPSATQPVPQPVVIPIPIQETIPILNDVSYTLNTSVSPPNSGAVSVTTSQYAQGDRIQVTVIAYAGFAFNHWSGDLSSNNPAPILVMDSNKVLVANFLDISPPVMSNVATTNSTDTKITIEWNTNEPATSQIEYGLTPAYGTNSSNNQLITNHSITLSGLIPDTNYYYRIDSTDAAGNQSLLPQGIFTTLHPSMAVSSLVYVQGAKVFYNLINNSSQTIIVTKVELIDQNGVVRHTDESTTIEVHNIGPLLSGDTLKESFSSPIIYINFSGWHAVWYCLDIDMARFSVTSDTISP